MFRESDVEIIRTHLVAIFETFLESENFDISSILNFVSSLEPHEYTFWNTVCCIYETSWVLIAERLAFCSHNRPQFWKKMKISCFYLYKRLTNVAPITTRRERLKSALYLRLKIKSKGDPLETKKNPRKSRTVPKNRKGDALHSSGFVGYV